MNDDSAMRIIERLQVLEKQKMTLFGVVLIALGIAMYALGQTMPIDVSNVRDFFAGLIEGLGIGTMLVGIGVTAYSMKK